MANPNRQFYAFRRIDTLDDALDAQRAGTGIAVLMLFGYAIYVGLAVFSGRGIYGEEQLDAFFYIGNGIAMSVAALIGLWIWTRRSLIGTILMALWYFLEMVFKLIEAPRTFNVTTVVLMFVALTCLILSIRGHLAAGRFSRTPSADTFS